MGATYTDEQGESHPMVMGSYGIGISRVVAAIVEEHHDEHGIAGPHAICALRRAPRRARSARAPPPTTCALRPTASTTNSPSAGVDVLYDDRDASPGVKFADADLVGMPVQLTVGAKGLARGVVERKIRATGERDELPLDEVVAESVLASNGVTLPVRPPFEPMLAKLSPRACPTATAVLFEPKWDGFRCIVFRDGDELDLQSRNSKPLLRYFPELREPLLAQLPEQCVLDGELVVVGEHGGLDFDALAAAPASGRLAGAQARSRDPRDLRGVRSARARRPSRCSTRRSNSGANSWSASLANAKPPLCAHTQRRAIRSSRATGSIASRAPVSTA